MDFVGQTGGLHRMTDLDRINTAPDNHPPTRPTSLVANWYQKEVAELLKSFLVHPKRRAILTTACRSLTIANEG
jgi:hypothetical protein